jgi:hypothetical protein
VRIEACIGPDHPGWLELRSALWPQGMRHEHLDEMAAFLREPQRYGQFVASIDAQAVGLVKPVRPR